MTEYKKHSPETIENMRQAKLGNKNPMFGKKHKKESRIKMTGLQWGEKHHGWKGDKVGKNALHRWVIRRFPKPELCQICNSKKSHDLANISGKYLRDLKDWWWLCRSCHMNSDGRIKNLMLGPLVRWRYIQYK
jgi:hypothetical protein